MEHMIHDEAASSPPSKPWLVLLLPVAFYVFGILIGISSITIAIPSAAVFIFVMVHLLWPRGINRWLRTVELSDTGFSGRREGGETFSIGWEEISEVGIIIPSATADGAIHIESPGGSVTVDKRFKRLEEIALATAETCLQKGIKLSLANCDYSSKKGFQLVAGGAFYNTSKDSKHRGIEFYGSIKALFPKRFLFAGAITIAFIVVVYLSLLKKPLLENAFFYGDKEAEAYLRSGENGARDKLLGGLEHESPAIRIDCLRMLLESPYLTDVFSLSHVLSDPHPVVRAAFVEVLAKYAGPDKARSVKLIEGRLSDDNEIVRVAAIRTLGKMSGKDSLETVAPFLADDKALVRLAAANFLAKFGDKRAIGVLIELLADRSCSSAAFVVLKEATGLTFNFDKEALEERKEAAIERWRAWWQANSDSFEIHKE